MAQLAQGLGFDLADPLARDVELLADLLERVRLAVDQTKAHAQHLLLPRRQRGQDFLELLAQQGIGGLLRRLRRLVVLDEVAEMAVFLLADGRFERDGLLRDLQDLFDLALLDVQLVGDLLRRRLAAKLLHHRVRGAQHPVDGLHHVHGDADRANL